MDLHTAVLVTILFAVCVSAFWAACMNFLARVLLRLVQSAALFATLAGGYLLVQVFLTFAAARPGRAGAVPTLAQLLRVDPDEFGWAAALVLSPNLLALSGAMVVCGLALFLLSAIAHALLQTASNTAQLAGSDDD